jgi:hypothetical protein
LRHGAPWAYTEPRESGVDRAVYPAPVEPPARAEDVDAAWLGAVLRLPPGSPAALRAERIGEGFGLGGTAARLHLEGAPGLPSTLVAKACRAADGEAEAGFYRQAAPRLDLRLPDFHGWFPDAAGTRGVLLLGDVGPARQGDALAGLPPAEAATVMAAAAAFHAAFWDRAGDPWLASLPTWTGIRPAKERRIPDAIPVFLARWGDRIPPAARAATERLPRLLRAARAALAPVPPTLLHGDLHADNVLLPAGGPPVILDWPCVERGPAAADFVHFLVEGVTAEVRRSGEGELAAAWTEEASRRGVPGRTAADLLPEADRAMVLLWSAIVGSAVHREAAPAAPPRREAVIANLVRNGAAFVADRGVGALA